MTPSETPAPPEWPELPEPGAPTTFHDLIKYLVALALTGGVFAGGADQYTPLPDYLIGSILLIIGTASGASIAVQYTRNRDVIAPPSFEPRTFSLPFGYTFSIRRRPM